MRGNRDRREWAAELVRGAGGEARHRGELARCARWSRGVVAICSRCELIARVTRPTKNAINAAASANAAHIAWRWRSNPMPP